jgi:hypothetical protein
MRVVSLENWQVLIFHDAILEVCCFDSTRAI